MDTIYCNGYATVSDDPEKIRVYEVAAISVLSDRGNDPKKMPLTVKDDYTSISMPFWVWKSVQSALQITSCRKGDEDEMLPEEPIFEEESPDGWTRAHFASTNIRTALKLLERADKIIAELTGHEGELTSRAEMADINPSIVDKLVKK